MFWSWLRTSDGHTPYNSVWKCSLRSVSSVFIPVGVSSCALPRLRWPAAPPEWLMQMGLVLGKHMKRSVWIVWRPQRGRRKWSTGWETDAKWSHRAGGDRSTPSVRWQAPCKGIQFCSIMVKHQRVFISTMIWSDVHFKKITFDRSRKNEWAKRMTVRTEH